MPRGAAVLGRRFPRQQPGKGLQAAGPVLGKKGLGVVVPFANQLSPGHGRTLPTEKVTAYAHHLAELWPTVWYYPSRGAARRGARAAVWSAANRYDRVAATR